MSESHHFIAGHTDSYAGTASYSSSAEISLHEQCGRNWSNELLRFPLYWAPGTQRQTHLVLTGPAGTLTTQLSDIIPHPDGSLARATLCCRLSLAADEEITLTVAEGENPVSSLPLPSWRKCIDETIEVSNGYLTARVPQSGCYCDCHAPGPVMACRLGEGEWLGQGSLQASTKVVLVTEFLDEGPLFVRWRCSYRYERVTLAAIDCTLYAGEDFIHIHENSSLDSDLVFHFDAFPALAPDHWMTNGGGEKISQAIFPLDYAREEEVAVVDFNSGHQQMSLTWLGVYREGGDACLGMVELNGAHWTNVSINRLYLTQAPPDSLLFSSPLQGGVKEWALVCTPLEKTLQQPGTRQPIRLCDIHRRYAGLPLQKVKEWVLTWNTDEEARPFLQCDTDGIAIARKRVQETPELLRAYRAWADSIAQAPSTSSFDTTVYATLWIALGEERFAREAVSALERDLQHCIATCWNEGGLIRLIIFDGRSMKMWLQAYDVLQAGGCIDAERDRRIRRDLAFLAYCLADPEFFPKHNNLVDHDDPNSFYYGLGQKIGDAMCPPNFHTEYYTTYGLMGCCFRTHPQAAAWRQEAAQLLERQLEVHFYDSGCYCESTNYHSHVFVMLNQFALALRRCGGPDFYQHPRFKAQFDYFCRMQTPPILLNEAAQSFISPWKFLDAEKERYAMLPGNGNSGSDCSDMPLPVELAIGGRIYRESDPALSARCMTTWRNAGRPMTNTFDNLTFLLCAEPALPGVEHLDQHSTVLTGSFVTFRGNPETPDEVYVLTKNGTATHHNCFDEGGFTIWAYGAPIASDYGYHAKHAGRSAGTTETWRHNCVEFDGKSSGYLGIEQTLPPEQWVSTELADLLVSYLPITNFRDPYMTYLDQVPAAHIEYRRYTLFVKPHYLLIFDSILSCPYMHRWWLHAQAHDIAVDGAQVRFSGKFGVDLLAQFITPAHPVITTGEWGVMKHIFAQQIQAHDWRVFVAPVKPGQTFHVSSTDAGRVVKVDTAEYSDTIFLAHFPFQHTDAQATFTGRAGVIRRTAGGDQVEHVLLDGELLEVK